MMKRIKYAGLNIAEETGALRLAQFPKQEAGNHLFVLTYHRVAETGTLLEHRMYDLITALPAQFDRQMKLISTCFQPVTAQDVVNALNGGRRLPAQAVLVTVDDGYRDFKETIFPIAKKYGIRPVLFLPTAFVGNGIFWWDRLHHAITSTTAKEIETPLGRFLLKDTSERQKVFDIFADHVRMMPFDQARSDIEDLCAEITPKQNPNLPYVLDWDELRGLSAEGVTIATHTHTHPILTHIPLNQARDEIRVSLQLIHQQIGPPLPIFAYPDGRDHAVSAELAAMLKQEGIQLAFTMSDRLSRLRQDDPQLFPRIVPDRSLSLGQFHLRLTALRARGN